MTYFLWKAFLTLLVVMNPFTIMPTFVSLTRNESAHIKRRMAIKSCSLSAVILLFFGIAGDKLLDTMGISEPAFRIAGGFLLFLVALDMVMSKNQSPSRPSSVDESDDALPREDISVFPLAIPLIAGPGALTTFLILMRQAEAVSLWATVGTCLVLGIMVLIIFTSFLIGDRLLSVFGGMGGNVLTRVFGVILASLAVQGMIHGVVLVMQSV